MEVKVKERIFRRLLVGWISVFRLKRKLSPSSRTDDSEDGLWRSYSWNHLSP